MSGRGLTLGPVAFNTERWNVDICHKNTGNSQVTKNISTNCFYPTNHSSTAEYWGGVNIILGIFTRTAQTCLSILFIMLGENTSLAE